jgi:hypothetical protein
MRRCGELRLNILGRWSRQGAAQTLRCTGAWTQLTVKETADENP